MRKHIRGVEWGMERVGFTRETRQDELVSFGDGVIMCSFSSSSSFRHVDNPAINS